MYEKPQRAIFDSPCCSACVSDVSMRKIHKELQGLLNVYKSYWEGEGGEGGSILISYLRQLNWMLWLIVV